MSSQSYLFNPTERTLAAAGDGFSAPRLTTTDRNALSLGVNGKGMMVYDTTLTTLCIWNGTAWEFVTDSSDVQLQYAGGARDAVCYAGAQSVRVFRDYATMGGFRCRGQYTKSLVPTFAMPSNKVVTSPGDLGGMTAKTNENWYAIFACANTGDATATLKMMPFLRAGVVAGSSIGLVKGGEGLTPPDVAQTYAWTSANNLADVDLLVITEAGGFSGRVTKITAVLRTTTHSCQPLRDMLTMFIWVRSTLTLLKSEIFTTLERS